MALTSKISLYNPQWPLAFAAERERIAPGFADDLLAIHHVGSTAVPGLAAKPEIDVLLVVARHRDEVLREAFMATLGYVRGSDLSVGHQFYRRDVQGVRTHKVHVCLVGHGQIQRMLGFRDLLRTDVELRQRYQELKLQLEASNRDGIGEYLARKAPFIDGVMDNQQA
ncbi:MULTISPECIES: GrpB family protein [unclassified Pseudomonas]|uniref:GrpB family protein n=1 Tax=unclassified Pseudomonas TaxID=196821 RepID=UPI00083809CD|nr:MULTISPECIES: GrpB family protein [unclassified Pseudomonas]QIH07243.1 GrpB family protein [Pseudomonas sp. BIOMIG1BAC]